jgi:outer membrane protein OmpA-like peptidoglycan-associated protein
MHAKLLIGLIGLTAAMLLTACSTQQPSKAESHAISRVHIEQASDGRFMLCMDCPRPTPKTAQPSNLMLEKPSHSTRIITSANDNNKTTMRKDDNTITPAGPLLIVQFKYDETGLRPSELQVLHQFAADEWPALAERGRVELKVAGFTDDIGPQEYNNELAYQRAIAVCETLRNLGVDARFEVIGQGRCCYKGDNETPDGRAMNRRVELSVSAITPATPSSPASSPGDSSSPFSSNHTTPKGGTNEDTRS